MQIEAIPHIDLNIYELYTLSTRYEFFMLTIIVHSNYTFNFDLFVLCRPAAPAGVYTLSTHLTFFYLTRSD